jgi:hypothetical protein
MNHLIEGFVKIVYFNVLCGLKSKIFTFLFGSLKHVLANISNP